MDDWTKNLKPSGLYYEGWVNDAEQVLGIHRRATVTSYGTRRSSKTSLTPSTATTEPENSCPAKSAKYEY